MWPRESGVVHAIAQAGEPGNADTLRFYADLADDFPFEEPFSPSTTSLAGGGFGLLVREPVGVVGAIIPWNAPLPLHPHKVAPALLAGCTVIVKVSPEAPGAGYLIAEIAEEIGLPAGVLNVLTADREVSELLVRDHRVDKITFTGSTAAGRKIGAICGERIARCTLELGGKSAAVILDDADIERRGNDIGRRGVLPVRPGVRVADADRGAAPTARRVRRRAGRGVLRGAGRRPVRRRHADGAAGDGAPARPSGALHRQGHRGGRDARDRWRPAQAPRSAGYYIEPTVFAEVDNKHVIAQEEIFGPVLSVIPADNDEHAVESPTTPSTASTRRCSPPTRTGRGEVAGRLRSGTVGHNGIRTDFGIAFGGFKQSGIGREGGREGLLPFLETKTVLLDGAPT